ncbi:MAG: DUF2024 family protein [Colwellia sp.]|nr:DUF2024 family protein [Colwellia sp.]
MKIHVYDTHVKTKTGGYVHFDVFVDDAHVNKAKQYAQQYISALGIEPEQIELNSCQFCHSEIANPEVQTTIIRQGHYILPLTNTQ